MSAKKSKKMDTAIVVAIIGVVGTILAALLASPILPTLLDGKSNATEAASATGNGSLVFANDFENGQASGFAFYNEEWQVIKEKGNPALEMSGTATDNGTAVFGPNDFSDGVIDFRLNFRNFGGFILTFRNVDIQTYTLYFSPAGGEITLGYGSAANDWDLEALGGGIRPFAFEEEVWYEVKLEAVGEQMTVWVDENKLLSSTDSRLQQGSMEFAIQEEGVVRIDDVEVREY